MKWNSTDIKPENKEKVIIDCEPIGIATTIYFTELESGPTKGWGIMGVKKWLPISVLDEPIESNTGYTTVEGHLPPVSEEGGIEERAKAWAKSNAKTGGFGEIKLAEAAYIAGANSIRQHEKLDLNKSEGVVYSDSVQVRQQGDEQEVRQSQLFRHVLEQCKAEELRSWRVMNEANKASGMGPIKKSSLLQLIENVLDNTESQSPSIPKPGFIEQLRKSCPYRSDASSGAIDIWNECVDKATELLGGKGEERRLQRQEDNNEHLGKCLRMLQYLYMNEYCGEHGEEVRQLIMPRPQSIIEGKGEEGNADKATFGELESTLYQAGCSVGKLDTIIEALLSKYIVTKKPL